MAIEAVLARVSDHRGLDDMDLHVAVHQHVVSLWQHLSKDPERWNEHAKDVGELEPHRARSAPLALVREVDRMPPLSVVIVHGAQRRHVPQQIDVSVSELHKVREDLVATVQDWIGRRHVEQEALVEGDTPVGIPGCVQRQRSFIHLREANGSHLLLPEVG